MGSELSNLNVSPFFTTLPPEIRNLIYSFIFTNEHGDPLTLIPIMAEQRYRYEEAVQSGRNPGRWNEAQEAQRKIDRYNMSRILIAPKHHSNAWLLAAIEKSREVLRQSNTTDSSIPCPMPFSTDFMGANKQFYDEAQVYLQKCTVKISCDRTKSLNQAELMALRNASKIRLHFDFNALDNTGLGAPACLIPELNIYKPPWGLWPLQLTRELKARKGRELSLTITIDGYKALDFAAIPPRYPPQVVKDFQDTIYSFETRALLSILSEVRVCFNGNCAVEVVYDAGMWKELRPECEQIVDSITKHTRHRAQVLDGNS